MSQVPEPGWYPNPENPQQIRWWDGQQWTDRTEPSPQQGAFPPPAGPPPGGAPTHPGFIQSTSSSTSTSEWVSEVMTIVGARAGHFFTLAVLLSLVPGLIQSVVMYFALNDMFLEYAEDGSSVTFEGVSGRGAGALAVVMILSWVVGLVMWIAFARQTQLTRVGRPETWSESLRSAVPRFPRVFGVQLLSLLMLLGAFVVLAIVAGLVSIAVPLLGLLLAVVGAVVVLLYISMVTPASAVAPKGVGSVSHGISLARGNGRYLLKRALAFSAMGLSIVIIFYIFSAALTRQEAVAVPTRDGFVTLTGDMVVGGSLLNHVLSQTITWLGQALSSVLMISGLVIAYGDLGGRFESSLEPKSDSQI